MKMKYRYNDLKLANEKIDELIEENVNQFIDYNQELRETNMAFDVAIVELAKYRPDKLREILAKVKNQEIEIRELKYKLDYKEKEVIDIPGKKSKKDDKMMSKKDEMKHKKKC